MPQMHCHRNQHWERRARGKMFKQATPRWPGIRCIFWGTSNIWRAKMFSVPATLLIPTIWHYRKQNFVSFPKFCLSLICAINFLMIFVIPVIHPPFPWPWYESSTWAGSNITCGCKITWSTCPRDPQTPLLCLPSLRLNPSMHGFNGLGEGALLHSATVTIYSWYVCNSIVTSKKRQTVEPFYGRQ